MKRPELFFERALRHELQVRVDRQLQRGTRIGRANHAFVTERNRTAELVGFEYDAPRMAAQELVLRVFDSIEAVFVRTDETENGRGQFAAGIDPQPRLFFL